MTVAVVLGMVSLCFVAGQELRLSPFFLSLTSERTVNGVACLSTLDEHAKVQCTNRDREKKRTRRGEPVTSFLTPDSLVLFAVLCRCWRGRKQELRRLHGSAGRRGRLWRCE